MVTKAVAETKRLWVYGGPDLKLFILVGWDWSFRLLLGPPGLN